MSRFFRSFDGGASQTPSPLSDKLPHGQSDYPISHSHQENDHVANVYAAYPPPPSRYIGCRRCVRRSSAQLRAASETNAIRPFRINIPEEQIADLRRRVAATRWPDKETVADPSQGIQLATI